MTQHLPKSANNPLLFVTLMTAALGQAHAAGFALIEQSASGLGNAFAGAGASAQDASTIFFNPAGLTHLSGNQFVVAGHIIEPNAEFSGSATNPLGAPITGGNGGDAGATGLIPNLYYSHQLANGFVFGLGVNAPFGLKTEYDSTWVGRYQAIESDLKTVNINPTIAYKAAPNLSVGVGVNVQYIDVTLSQAANQNLTCISVRMSPPFSEGLATAAGNCATVTGDTIATVKGDDWSYGYNFGLLYDVSPSTRVGFAYRSKIKQQLEGDASFGNTHPFFTAVGVLVPTSVTADVTLPENASLSVSHDVNNQWTLLADATWTHWNRFQELRIDFASNQPDSVTVEDWDNSMRYSLGVNYRHNSTWLLRAGVAFDAEPIPSDQRRTPRIPGNDRTWLAFGANYALSPSMSVDVGYAHLFVDDTRIDHTSSTAGNITGKYDNSVDILSAQMNWTF